MDRSSIRHSRHAPIKKTQSRDFYEDEYDDVWPVRMPSSVRRYQNDIQELGNTQADVQSLAQEDHFTSYPGRKNNVPARRTASYPSVPALPPARRGATNTNIPALPAARRHPTSTNIPALPAPRRKAIDTDTIIARRGGKMPNKHHHTGPHFHWLVYVGISMLIILICWTALSALSSWWQVQLDDWHYGRPRTYQVDKVVGHNDAQVPSHFIALNLDRHIQIIEIPGGDSTKVKIYIGPTLIGQGQDLAPVTLDFKDVTNDGKLDMIVNVQNSHFVFVNDNGSFRPLRNGENVHS